MYLPKNKATKNGTHVQNKGQNKLAKPTATVTLMFRCLNYSSKGNLITHSVSVCAVEP